ncbi:hypothetical protein [Paludisphaera mucosa]|uniref:Glycosyltransferase RgtA/B/C/D-like domain-containing protein n=1 Tax=Paludisphaera mucosa TaxID=3030827 RepID=A0ABT6FA33_9BACT|nr:hypothetical protein [Paludisphaera mucosa]MDG3004415.1 hypothetical protein [Paludisphaera mucosa]
METEPSEPVVPTAPPGAAAPPRRPVLERIVRIGVLVGLAMRIWEYSDLRSLYIDEAALLTNLVDVPVFDFGHILKQDQLAPPGFLVVERLLVRLPIPVEASGRLFPLLCGLASMLLIAPLARRYLDRLAVPIAVWMLALADHLIYYSAEIKPYTCDLIGAMATLLLAVPPGSAGPSRRRLAALAAWGVVAPWFSFPVVFVLAGVGLHLIVRAWRADGARGAARAVAVCGGWFISFLGCFFVSRAIVSKGDFLWTWWNFSFLPIPPRSWVDARFTIETVANVFINPGSVLTPFGFISTAILASALAFAGAFSLGRRWRGGLFVLLTPLLLHLAASALRQYPFHGRLILSLVPTYHLLLAEGMAAVGRASRPWATLVLALAFVGGQAGDIFWNQMVMPRSRSRPFDTHGDLKNDLLDDLDFRRKIKPKTPEAVPLGLHEPGRSSFSPPWEKVAGGRMRGSSSDADLLTAQGRTGFEVRGSGIGIPLIRPCGPPSTTRGEGRSATASTLVPSHPATAG